MNSSKGILWYELNKDTDEHAKELVSMSLECIARTGSVVADAMNELSKELAMVQDAFGHGYVPSAGKLKDLVTMIDSLSVAMHGFDSVLMGFTGSMGVLTCIQAGMIKKRVT